MSALEILVFILATWRISSLVVIESGPFDIFQKLRKWTGIEDLPYVEAGEMRIVPERFLPQVISCVWCTSVYIGIAWVIFFLFSPTIAFYAAIPFALSAGAILLNLVVEKLK